MNSSPIGKKRAEQKAQADQKAQHDEIVGAVQSSADKVAKTVAANKKVTIANPDLAKTDDVQNVVDSINKLNITAFMSNKDSLESWGELVGSLSDLSDKLNGSIASIKDEAGKTDKLFESAVKQLGNTVGSLKSLKVEADDELKKALSQISYTLGSIDFKPTVNIPEPKVVINEKEIDFKPLAALLSNLDKGITKLSSATPSFDTGELSEGIDAVEKAVRDLIARPIPVPESPLPFKDSDNKGVQKQIILPSERVFQRVSNTDGASTAFSSFGAVPGKINYVRGYTIANTSSTNAYVDFRDGVSGSVIWTVPIPANGGANVMLDEPIFWTSANTALAYDVSLALSTVYISITGYQAG